MNDDTKIAVSICCAAYNHEEYIEQTLQSFVDQVTDFKFEVIVHDDVSTDGTRAIIQKYVDLYPDIFVPIFQTENQYSKGKGIVTRIMFAKARGKYIASCEGDDYWCDNYKLQKQYDIMEKHEECSLCVHKTKPIVVNQELNKKSNVGIRINKTYNLQAGIIEKNQIAKALWLEGGYPFHTSSYFYRKRVLEDWISEKAEFIKYMNGDAVILRLCLEYGKFYYLDEVMSCRRKGVKQSWSVRWAESSKQEKAERYQQLIEGERLYDKYTEGKFHDYIKIHVFNLIAECCLYDTSNIKKCAKENPLKMNIIHDKNTLWMYIRYLLLRISPRFYMWLYDIQTKVKKKKS